MAVLQDAYYGPAQGSHCDCYVLSWIHNGQMTPLRALELGVRKAGLSKLASGVESDLAVFKKPQESFCRILMRVEKRLLLCQYSDFCTQAIE
jgi:hypothetical protein